MHLIFSPLPAPFCLLRDNTDKEAEPSLGSAAFDVDNMQLSGLDLGPQVWYDSRCTEELSEVSYM